MLTFLKLEKDSFSFFTIIKKCKKAFIYRCLTGFLVYVSIDVERLLKAGRCSPIFYRIQGVKDWRDLYETKLEFQA